jgi:hypothetical protein
MCRVLSTLVDLTLDENPGGNDEDKIWTFCDKAE